MTSNLLSINSITNLFFHSLSFVSFFKAVKNVLIINLVKHGDKSKVNNLNKLIAFFGSVPFIITSITPFIPINI